MNVEQKYSVDNKASIILEDVSLDFKQEFHLLSKIAGWNTSDYDNQQILEHYLVVLFDESRKRPVQDLGTRIGYKIGAKDALEAVVMGTELLQLLEGPLHTIDDELEVHSTYRLNRSTFKKLYRLHYIPPLQEKPLDWDSNHGGGWYYHDKSIVLGKGNHHEYVQAYDAVNELQSIPWVLDPDVVIEEKGDKPNNQRFLRVVADTLGEEFYFVWRYDKRGRSYSQGYDINLQGTEYDKALLSLANEEVIEDIDSLKIAIANHAGMDKLTWQERIDWFDAQNGEFDLDQFDEPILGKKALRAWEDTMEGRSTGYWMSLDATNSGYQIMAALSGCKKTAATCNLVNGGERVDLYSDICKEMNKYLEPEDQIII